MNKRKNKIFNFQDIGVGQTMKWFA